MSYPKLRKVNTIYGAPMGRFSDKTDAATNVSVSRLAMTSDGVYDIGGAYWGIGEPIYRAAWYDSDGMACEAFVCANSRDEAIALFELESHQLLRGVSRKSEYHVMGNYGYGWDSEYSSEDLAEAKARLKEYQQNGGGSYRLKTVKV